MSSADNFSYDIAIIGMAGRFPGARNVEEFWQNLLGGVESITFFSDEELLQAGVEPQLVNESNYVKAGAVIEDEDYFDASFFNFTRREAEMMDPQHRLFLEHAWQALEGAGYDADVHSGRVGIFAGESVNTYLLHNLLPQRELLERVGHFQTLIGNDRDHLTTYTAYKLNLKGPCVNVQTACSTSLVAVHLACQSLLNHECDMALAGGVSVSVPQRQGALYEEGSIVSPDGHCRAFDARAAGTVKGNGVGVVVLKRLVDALADGDQIDAVIKGSAINNDGSLKVGYTAPSVEGQASVIAEAMAVAAVEPETITYVETHGTGTSLGDPVEIAALTQAFGAATEAKGFCAIGSVKTNIGHLDAAAGVVGLIKTALALKHKQLPPSLHFEQPNPNIEFARTPFYVNTNLTAWETTGSPRRAGVSSFGIGGTNAHVILEEAPQLKPSGASRTTELLTLSAKTATALDQMTSNLAAYLKERPRTNLADVAYTLQVGRKDFNYRRALLCRNVDDALSALEPIDRSRVHTNFQERETNAVVFMFPGQGSQHVNMARELYESEPGFRAEVDACAELLVAHLGFDIRGVLYPQADSGEKSAERLTQTFITQPALFVIEYALARLWMEWGVRPVAMIGHSIGEFVAACLAGVFSLEDALKLVAARGRLMQSMPAGAMLAVPLSEQEVQPFLSDPLSVAAINGPSLCVISGAVEAVGLVEQQLAANGVACHPLHTSHAYHSQMMEPVSGLFAAEVAQVKLRAPQIPYISGLSATWIKAEEATSIDYWSRQLREPVRFSAGVAKLLKEHGRILLEVGPGQTLSMLAQQQQNGTAARLILSSLPRQRGERQTDASHLLNTLGQLWAAGTQVDWAAFHSGEERRRLPLPTYPFERERYWIDAEAQTTAGAAAFDSLRRKPESADWFYVPSWKRVAVEREAQGESALPENGCCLIFADECGIGELIAARLESSGREVFIVRAGESFNHVAGRVFEIDARRREDYDALLNELRARGKRPEAILHAWGVSEESGQALTLDSFESSQANGFYSLLFLAQALGEGLLTDALRVAVVTNNVQEVTGEEALSPEKATILGLCQVIPQEYPQINCRSIDITLPRLEAERGVLADHLIAELDGRASEGAAIAYRGRHRWMQIFEPLKFVESLRDASRQGRLREGGVYLLTGGPGDIDLAIARHLAGSVRCKIVLNGYANLPPREEWPQWLEANGEQEEVRGRIRKVLELESAGAEVMLSGADVGDLEQVSSLITKTRESFGHINGIFHTAAVTGGGMIQLKRADAVAAVFRPKVRGTLALASLLEDAPPDFFVLFSTSLSLTGVFGQVDYCAANAFLDAFARARTSSKTLTVAVNWNLPQWENWQESSLAAAPEFQARFAEMRKSYGLTPEEGAESLTRILRGTQPQVIVSTQDFQALVDAQKTAVGSDLLDGLKPAPLFDGAEDERAANYALPEGEMEERVASLWQELFGIARVGRDENFFELGGNSLVAIQLVSQLRKLFQVELPLSRLFESPTVTGLTVAVIESQQKAREAEEVERLLREIEGLSPDDLQAHLAQELQTGSEQNLDG